MRKQYLSILKVHFRESLLLARAHSGLTQEEMAPRLLTSVRSYCALESGESCCGALTLVLFLVNVCEAPREFLVGLRNAFATEASKVA